MPSSFSDIGVPADVVTSLAARGITDPFAIQSLTTKKVDIQLNTNLRQIILFYREALELLKAAGEEHRNAHVINTASVAGKRGEAWLSIYSATKFAVVGWTESMNRELKDFGIKNCAICPAFVDTPMTDFVKGQVPPESMIQTTDIAEMVRAMLKLTPGALVPELVFTGPGGISTASG